MSSAPLFVTNDPGAFRRLGKFTIRRKLGEGGMGVVWEAVDDSLKRIVALKTLHPGCRDDEKLRKRFLSEARAVARLRHPGVITIHEMGEIEGSPYFSMEMIEGDSLASLSRRGISPKRAVELIVEVARAVGFAHQEGVIHRDLKPGNIMVRTSGVPVVLDFGLAKDLDASSTRDLSLTQQGEAVGTPAYMAPEQVRGDKASIGPQTDVYALGVVLFELLARGLPFVATTLPMLWMKILREAAPRVSTKDLGLPAGVGTVIERCLHKSPARRYPDGTRLGVALREALSGSLMSVAGRVLTLESGAGSRYATPPGGMPIVAPPAAGDARRAGATPPRGVPQVPAPRLAGMPGSMRATAPPSARPAPRRKGLLWGLSTVATALLVLGAYALLRRPNPPERLDSPDPPPGPTSHVDPGRPSTPTGDDPKELADRFDQAVEEAWTIAREKEDADDALERLRQARVTLPAEGFSAKLDGECEKIRSWVAEHKAMQEEAAERTSREGVAAVRQEILDLLSSWATEEADLRCRKAMADRPEPDAKELGGLLAEIQSVRVLRQHVVDHWAPILAATPGAGGDAKPSMEVEGKSWRIREIATQDLLLEDMEGNVVRKAWGGLPKVQLCERLVTPAIRGGAADDHAALGALLLHDQAFMEADRELALAQEAGGNVEAQAQRLGEEFPRGARRRAELARRSLRAGRSAEALATAMSLLLATRNGRLLAGHAREVEPEAERLLADVAGEGRFLDFSDGRQTSDWEKSGDGTWEIGNGVLTASGSRSTCVLRAPSLREIAAMVRLQDASTSLTIQVGMAPVTLKVQFLVWKQCIVCQGMKGLRSVEFHYDPNRWYAIRIESSEGRASIYLDDMEHPLCVFEQDGEFSDVALTVECTNERPGRALLDNLLLR